MILLRLLCLIAVLLLPGLALADGTATELDPALRERVENRDPYAAFEAGDVLSQVWEEPNLEVALDYYTRAYAWADETPEGRYLKASAAVMIGRIRRTLSDYTDGIVFSQEAEDIARSLSETFDTTSLVAMAMNDRAASLIALSRYDEALEILGLLETYYLSRPDHDPEVLAALYWDRGWPLLQLDRFDEALRDYNAALAFFVAKEGMSGASVAAIYGNIGWIRHRQGDYAGAETTTRSALAIYEAQAGPYAANTSAMYVNLALHLFELERPKEAIEAGLRAMPFIAANRRQSLDHQRWLFELFAKSFAALGNPDRAIFFGKMAVNAQQEVRAANTRESGLKPEALQNEWRRLYQLLADLLITQGRISEAQAVLNMEKEEEVFNFLRRDIEADITKTRALLNDAELTEEARLTALVDMPIAAERELRALTVKLEAGNATPEEEDRIFVLQDALQTAASLFDAEVAAFLQASDPATREVLTPQFDAVGSYQQILADLGRPTAILQVATLEDATHLFLTLPGVTLHEQVDIPRADLSRLVFDALTAIEDISPDAPARLQALHAVLFAPVAQALADSGTEVVMLNLDGFLRYVPFAALHDGKGWLIERYAFAMYTPAVPTQFTTPARDPGATAGFGVTAAHPGFSPLPGVAAELAAIFGQVDGVLDGKTALDGGFDERSLRRTLLGKPEILHIASHFNLLPGREDDSFLLLGDGSHLPLSRIRSTRALRFQGVDLLTLSACQTARGGDGSEIDGFAATAQLNGAGAVMASLWPVSDVATPVLMRDFYAGLMQGGLDKAQALRAAQIAMLRSDASGTGAPRAATALNPPAPAQGFAHPYYWSAFVLMGNWL